MKENDQEEDPKHMDRRNQKGYRNKMGKQDERQENEVGEQRLLEISL